MSIESNGEAAVSTLSVPYKVTSSNSCPFCGCGELSACTCFSGTSNNGKIKPECEGCAG